MEDIKELIDPVVGKIYDSPKGKVIFQLANPHRGEYVCDRCVFQFDNPCTFLHCGELGYFAPLYIRNPILDAFCKANCDGKPPRGACEKYDRTCEKYNRFKEYIEPTQK